MQKTERSRKMQPAGGGPLKMRRLDASYRKPRMRGRIQGRQFAFRFPGEVTVDLPALPIGNPVVIPPR